MVSKQDGELLMPLTAGADGLCFSSSPCKKRDKLFKAGIFPDFQLGTAVDFDVKFSLCALFIGV